MARRRLGDRVVLVRVGEHGAALHQPREAAGELATEPREVVGAELVDRHQHHQRGPRGGARGILRALAVALRAGGAGPAAGEGKPYEGDGAARHAPNLGGRSGRCNHGVPHSGARY